ncbi:PGF-pre-PGF domain-containing protein [Halorubrum sp. LN27]|uniref:PGF-pre-PGF domain-containing protein n=1 Tax=Halorubrum sp. LN27 TaxID=2801032 RepID=UPI0019092360|nr:PGF-pre-PGF domain-containing protein [Halorubrum sp. LN27]
MNVRHALGMTALIVLVATLVAVGGVVNGAAAQDGPPSTPASYYGQVTVTGGEPVDGVTVEAVVDGEVRDSIETDADGSFGGPGAFDEKLTVEGPVDGDVTFRVEGTDAGSAAWESGANEEVALELEEAPSDPGDGGDGADGGDGGDGIDPGDGDDGSNAGPSDGGDGGSGPVGGVGGAGGTGGSDDGPGDGPAVEDVVDVPAGATAAGGEVASVEANPDGASSGVAFTGETAVDGIEFDGVVEGDVGVVELDGAPEATGRPPGAGVSVVEISVPEAARDTSATVRTRIGADRLAASDADAEDLRLFRHADGEWQALETSVVEDDGEAVVLAAETPGFSVFSVSAVSEPDAAITVGSDSVTTGETVSLFGAQSTDEYGEIVAYDWVIDGEADAGITAEATFAEPGEYPVELVVTNDAGETDTARATIVVESTDAGSGAVEEPGLASPTTIGAVVGALLLALLVVAAVRRVDR